MKEIEALLDQCNVVQTTILFITSTYTMPKYNNEKSKYALTLLLYCNTSCCHAVDFLQTHPKWVGGQETPYQSLTFFSFAWYNHLKSFRRSITIHTLMPQLCKKSLSYLWWFNLSTMYSYVKRRHFGQLLASMCVVHDRNHYFGLGRIPEHPNLPILLADTVTD